MSRQELKEIIIEVVRRVSGDEEGPPRPACIFSDDDPCDMTTEYSVNEEG